MVTSNKLPDRKVVKMAEHNNSVVVPQRTLLGEVNEHIMCPLCRGYYIDATTIVECLHSFCRSCIIKHLQVKSYCPVCEMMINSAKPNIKLDKALQDIVYKLVPGLFQKEMERRQQFYSSRPGPAASATPEQRGEDTERVIFSPEDVISFSLEYADATDADSISSKSSDSNELQPVPATTRRFLQCPAVVNISHLKKFLSMKFDIDSTQFAIDILYKRVPLPDYYTLMDIAYIYNWKRNEPMRFFYQIIDYIAIRNRLFDVNRKGSNFRDRKSSPASTEDTNISSPTLHLNDQGSEASSGTDSPMPEESTAKQSHNSNISERSNLQNQDIEDKTCPSPKKLDEDVEKSQFLNSFELTPKSNCVPTKSSPNKVSVSEDTMSNDATKTSTNSNNEDTKVLDTLKKKCQIQPNTPNKDDGKAVDTLKRKYQIPPNTPEMKKLKIELEKAKVPFTSIKSPGAGLSTQNQDEKFESLSTDTKINEGTSKSIVVEPSQLTNTPPSILPIPAKDNKQQSNPIIHQHPENSGKRTSVCPQNVSSPKRRPNEAVASVLAPPVGPKTISPLKLQMPKLDSQSLSCKPIEPPKPTVKKMPDLKPSTPTSQIPQSKVQPATTIRMDLLANNSDPTIDRSKILSQVKTSLSPQTIGQSSGDPLKSLLFDSCKINIPSSLSITLTDQKLDLRNQSDGNVDPKKGVVNKNLAGASNGSSHKVPSPPVHNYIEILKLPDSDPKKLTKPDPGTGDAKTNPQNKMESPTQSKGNKSSETSSTKGPVPNLKPIADTKLGKQSGNYSSPITFQQTFEQQVQSMQCDKKSKLPKNKAQVPKLMPATSKSFPGKPNGSINKPNTSTILAMENKTAAALDLSTPHSIQNQLGQQQTFDKVFETMQSIANLAKKQSLPTKGLPLSMSQNNVFPSNRPMNTGVSPLRIPSTSNMNQMKIDKAGTSMTQLNNSRQELVNMKTNLIKPSNSGSPTVPSASYQIAPHPSPSPTHPSPRSQTRSPSSSPKLVIAEDKQGGNVTSEQSLNQSNQITSTQLPHLAPKSVSPKAIPGPSRPGLKPAKTLPPVSKITGIRQPITPTLKPGPQLANPSDYLSRPQLMAHQHHALLRHQIEMNAWIKAQRQDILKNMSSMAHQTQNDFNNKDKQ